MQPDKLEALPFVATCLWKACADARLHAVPIPIHTCLRCLRLQRSLWHACYMTWRLYAEILAAGPYQGLRFKLIACTAPLFIGLVTRMGPFSQTQLPHEAAGRELVAFFPAIIRFNPKMPQNIRTHRPGVCQFGFRKPAQPANRMTLRTST